MTSRMNQCQEYHCIKRVSASQANKSFDAKLALLNKKKIIDFSALTNEVVRAILGQIFLLDN